MARDIMVVTAQQLARTGNYGEFPVLPAGIDLQLHLSANDVQQPFWLVCEHDTVIVTLSGEGRVEFRDSPYLYQSYESGDFIYVPAGTPTRIKPATRSVQYRYKAADAGLEGVAWYCESCGHRLHREVWDTAQELSQNAYARICEAFNGDSKKRTCEACGNSHGPLELDAFRWSKIADDIKAQSAPAEA